jgi:cephalosporin-C deacetylase-like acetyl esterase
MLAGDGSADKDLPAVVLIHGGGGTAFAEWVRLWAERGYAAIAMDLAGHRPVAGQNPHARTNRTRLPNGGPNQGDPEKFGSIDKAPGEQWPYHAVAAVLRAHSLIRSFPEVDADRTAVTGISWGGYLTCIVSGVDSRFKAAVPVYGCGFLHENSVWLNRFAKMTPEQRRRWITLWDPSQYLPAVGMPILFVNGTNDFAYPLDSYMKSYDAVPGEKSLRVTVNMPHSHPAGWAPQEIGLFIDSHLRDGTALPAVGAPSGDGEVVRVAVESPVTCARAALHLTTDTGPINKRTWQTQAAAIDGTTITSPSPPPETTAWFLTVTDRRGATVSSRVVLCGETPERPSVGLGGSVRRPATAQKELKPWIAPRSNELIAERSATILSGQRRHPPLNLRRTWRQNASNRVSRHCGSGLPSISSERKGAERVLRWNR